MFGTLLQRVGSWFQSLRGHGFQGIHWTPGLPHLPHLAHVPVSFSMPVFLLLLPLLGAFYWLAHRNRRVPRGPWPLSLWLRGGVALLIILALAGLRVPAPAKSVDTIFLVDQSASIPADIRATAKQWVNQAIAAKGPDDQVGVVSFGKAPRVELPLGKATSFDGWSVGPAAPDGSSTNIDQALQVAADLLPPAGNGVLRRLVLLSDGVETDGSAQQALLHPQLRDVEVAVMALPQRLQDTAITDFSVLPTMRQGEGAEARLAIYSADQQTATLHIWAQGGAISQQVYEQPVTLAPGPKEITVDLGDLPKGAWSLHAQLDVPNDSQPENNQSWAFTVVTDGPQVLVLEGAPGDGAAVAASLAQAKVNVATLPASQAPSSMDQLLTYDAVVLANVPSKALGNARMDLLRRYVSEQGHGLVALGGENTYGQGDYANTPLEEALPVTVQPPERDQTATLALVLVIDRSGSMSATDTQDRKTSRIDLAKAGAFQAAQTVQPGDQVGVISFDYDARWVAEVRPINGPADQKALADRIATIQADGGTDIYRALDLAYRGLQQVNARVKHVILLTDGEQGSPAPFAQLVGAMQRQGITVSTLGISSEGSAAATLQNIARLGQGRFYVARSADEVPRIMTQEARLAGKSFKQERDFKPQVATAAPAVRGLVPADLPQLHAYMRVSARPGAEVVLTSDQQEVILAQWQYGLGRAIAWTSDPGMAWAKDWAGTDQFNHLWPQVIRWVAPAPRTPGVQAVITPQGSIAHLAVESFEPTGEFRDHLITTADVVSPDGTGTRVTLPQSAPGRYETDLPLTKPGVSFVHITQTAPDGTPVEEYTTGYVLPYLPEYRLSSPNRVLLERLAAETGGPVVAQVSDAWRKDTGQGWQPQEVWDYLIMAALALFVADVAARRFQPSMADLRDLRHATGRRFHLGLPRRPRFSLGGLRLSSFHLGRR